MANGQRSHLSNERCKHHRRWDILSRHIFKFKKQFNKQYTKRASESLYQNAQRISINSTSTSQKNRKRSNNQKKKSKAPTDTICPPFKNVTPLLFESVKMKSEFWHERTTVKRRRSRYYLGVSFLLLQDNRTTVEKQIHKLKLHVQIRPNMNALDTEGSKRWEINDLNPNLFGNIFLSTPSWPEHGKNRPNEMIRQQSVKSETHFLKGIGIYRRQDLHTTQKQIEV